MKSKFLGLFLLASVALISLPACNKGYGCQATESMKSSSDQGSSKKGMFKKNKSQSGRLF